MQKTNEGAAGIEDIMSSYKIPSTEDSSGFEKCTVEESLVSFNKLLEELEGVIEETDEEGQKDDGRAEQAEFEMYQQLKPYVEICRTLSDKLRVSNDGKLQIMGNAVNQTDIEALEIVVAFMYEEYTQSREMTEDYYDEDTEKDIWFDDEENPNIFTLGTSGRSEIDELMDDVEKESIEGLTRVYQARYILKLLIENYGDKKN